MALTLQTKQPDESRLYNFDFSGLMTTTETISSITSVVASGAGLTVGSTAISGQTVQVRLSAGTAATEYLVTAKIVTSTSSTLELEGRLWIEDITTLSALEQAALDELIMLSDANTCPVLDYATAKSELRRILTKNIRGTVWTLSTAYDIGDRIIPTAANRNGSRYRAVAFTATGTDQKTGATEPTWSTTREAQITDNHVIWQEDGWDWDGALWDLNAAACAAWELKASKSVGRVDFETQNMSVDASQLYEHCIAQAKRFQSSYCL